MIASSIISLLLPASAWQPVKGLRLRRAHMGERADARGALDGLPPVPAHPSRSEMMAAPCQRCEKYRIRNTACVGSAL